MNKGRGERKEEERKRERERERERRRRRRRRKRKIKRERRWEILGFFGFENQIFSVFNFSKKISFSIVLR